MQYTRFENYTTASTQHHNNKAMKKATLNFKKREREETTVFVCHIHINRSHVWQHRAQYTRYTQTRTNETMEKK